MLDLELFTTRPALTAGYLDTFYVKCVHITRDVSPKNFSLIS